MAANIPVSAPVGRAPTASTRPAGRSRVDDMIEGKGRACRHDRGRYAIAPPIVGADNIGTMCAVGRYRPTAQSRSLVRQALAMALHA